jgi:RND superfamily putative drug exporter
VGVWVLILVAMTPVVLTYTHYLDYSASSSALAGTESQRAADLLASTAPSHAVLLIAVDESGLAPAQVENGTLALQANLARAHIAYFNGSSSVYSSYATYLDGLWGAQLPAVRALHASQLNLSDAVYGFPAAFLGAWEANGSTAATINTTYAALRGPASGYPAAFRDALAANYTASRSASAQAQAAVLAAAPGYFPSSSALALTLNDASVTNYTAATDALVALELGASSGTPVAPSWVEAAVAPGDFGQNLVAQDGIGAAPSFVTAPYISPNGAVSLVLVEFSVSESFRTSDGTYPSQAATPVVRTIASQVFGARAQVTGEGAAAFDSAQISNASGFVFALIFVFLAVAVGLTLRSWIAPLLSLVLVSVAEVIGYFAIALTGLFVGRVDFTVTYVLTAVTLGVSTDYLLFVFYRYREELARGRPPEVAAETAMRSSGFAVLVSAITVAVGLGTLSFLNGAESWGPVLFITVLGIGVLEATLLPALLRLIGPRLFIRRWLTPAPDASRSAFYRAASGASRRPKTVLLLAAMIAVPAVIGFLVVPTSYDLNGSLPASTPSAQGQATIQNAFGANLLYPTYVIVTAHTAFFTSNGSLTPEGDQVLPGVARSLTHLSGVQTVVGPFVSGGQIGGGAGAAVYSLEGGRSAYFTVYSSFGPYSSNALALVSTLRANSSYLVGGVTSSVIDEQAQNSVQYPLLEIVLTVFIALVLGLAFRSVTVPVISVAGVFLSVASTTGLLYLVSRYLLHQALLWLIPLILFVLLMSLGNDYTVFLVSRIREEQAQFGRIEGIPRGIAGSGVVVSALGLILAASLGSLALSPLGFLEELGIAFVISLVLDTFVIRPFFFPAALRCVESGRERWRGSAGSPAGREG